LNIEILFNYGSFAARIGIKAVLVGKKKIYRLLILNHDYIFKSKMKKVVMYFGVCSTSNGQNLKSFVNVN
jgi:hypothetical protein